jgi:putative transposase
LQQSKLTQNSDQSHAHKTEGIKDMIEAAGAKIIYLPRYSSDFNPIEHLWWELKAFVRKFKPKTRVLSIS